MIILDVQTHQVQSTIDARDNNGNIQTYRAGRPFLVFALLVFDAEWVYRIDDVFPIRVGNKSIDVRITSLTQERHHWQIIGEYRR